MSERSCSAEFKKRRHPGGYVDDGSRGQDKEYRGSRGFVDEQRRKPVGSSDGAGLKATDSRNNGRGYLTIMTRKKQERRCQL